jgi:transcriptional regulator with XRE-family HTH domain
MADRAPNIARAIRTHREALGMTQGELAAAVGVDQRQIRRYEAGETQPAFSVAVAIAKALRVSLEQLAGQDIHRVELSGEWWACWQTFRDGAEVLSPQEVRLRQHGDTIEALAITRGTPLEEGGYLWRGEMKLWDNEILLGWYVANEGAVRSKGVMYFVLHPHGIHMSGRWVGLSYDGPIVTGWGAIAHSRDEALSVMSHLKETGAPPS